MDWNNIKDKPLFDMRHTNVNTMQNVYINIIIDTLKHFDNRLDDVEQLLDAVFEKVEDLQHRAGIKDV